MKKFFNFDVNMTEACTLRCTYCIENFNKSKLHNLSDEMLNKIIEKFDYLLNSDKFLKHYSGINIFFWGGEPTVNFNGMKKFIEHYKDKDNVGFFIYSNGFRYSDEMIDYIKKYQYPISNGHPKLELQISYDGLASHDVARLDIKGKGSALKVKETIFRLAKEGINFHLHPTIDFNNLDKISENYFEFKKMSEFLNTNFIYSPTIDYLSDHNYTKEQMDNFISIIKNQFKKIKNSEIEYFKKNNHFRFGWLNPSKKICGAGSDVNAIELDGNSYACHGILNGNVKENSIENSINNTNEDFLNTLLKSIEKYQEAREVLPEECKNCKTHYCLKCNAKKYEISEKETFKEKWSDYPNQPALCQIYKFIGNVRLAFVNIANIADIANLDKYNKK